MNIVMLNALRANQCSQGAVQSVVRCQDLTSKQLVKFNIVCQIICSRASSCCKLHIGTLSRLNVEALKRALNFGTMVHGDAYETACCRRLYCLHVNEP